MVRLARRDGNTLDGQALDVARPCLQAQALKKPKHVSRFESCRQPMNVPLEWEKASGSWRRAVDSLGSGKSPHRLSSNLQGGSTHKTLGRKGDSRCMVARSGGKRVVMGPLQYFLEGDR